VANVLSKAAGSNPEDRHSFYPYGTMSDLVYPVDGGLEDWVYSSGWENDFLTASSNKLIVNCTDPSNPEQKIMSHIKKLKCLLFLVEMADSKQPDEKYLGTRTALYVGGDHWGHITRNLALSFALIDLVEPYIR
jgi:hypothetical protein